MPEVHVVDVDGDVIGGPVLTVQQKAVLQLVADGLTNEQVAARLVCSPETVRTHLANTGKRLGTSGKAHAVAAGFRLGMLS
ncbi:hypothetical protein GCM10010172_35300 [Paractinoplanes ferrugineus]|uniref:HTH luxR-type domain-containing protein n=1 Tax=Paractinoplanes ferrugineus TaxID=113564 RepID=A0A919JAK1_9ACTN|nr:helix-turn-helix transcriptional regulator [Actinoplanes ferrugineus]GIE16760.1 hypothetical protein Afe05nite_86000 [Actinoplanes ferrugineus]